MQSLASKIEAIEPELSNFDVICLTETWLDHRTSDDLLALSEYTLYRRDRGRDAYGGICVYVKNELYSRAEMILSGRCRMCLARNSQPQQKGSHRHFLQTS